MTDISLTDLVAYLDALLDIASIEDGPGALNGLQIQNSGSVKRIAVAVDACQATIDSAVALSADLLLVHHGLFWGPAQPVTGRHWRRLKALLDNDLAVYSAHLPLDSHPELGNNVVLADKLGLQDCSPFGEYHGVLVGIRGTVEVTRPNFIERVTAVLGHAPHVIPGGPAKLRHVGIVTGGGGSLIDQARDCGLDTFVTGEGSHHTHFDAEEGGINLIYGGHYATETFGVKALAAYLNDHFNIPWDFVDHPTGL